MMNTLRQRKEIKVYNKDIHLNNRLSARFMDHAIGRNYSTSIGLVLMTTYIIELDQGESYE